MNQTETAEYAAEAIINGCGRCPREVNEFLNRWEPAAFAEAWAKLKGLWKIGAGLDAIRHHHFDLHMKNVAERGADYTWGLCLRHLKTFVLQEEGFRLLSADETKKEMNIIRNQLGLS